MPTKLRARTVTAAFALAVTVAPMASVLPAGAEAPSHLTVDDADAVLGTWGLDSWRKAQALPQSLRWEGSCSTTLMGGDKAVLREHDDAAIRSGVAVRSDDQAARRTARRAAQRVESCQAGYPEAARTVTGLRIRTAKGFARAYGTQVGTGRHAVKAEYVVVARSGRAAEVATFRAFAQDVLPEKTLRALARRVIARLHNAS